MGNASRLRMTGLGEEERVLRSKERKAQEENQEHERRRVAIEALLSALFRGYEE